VVLLYARQALPSGNGWRNQPVSWNDPTYALFVPLTLFSPKTGNNTIANYAILAAKAPENVTPTAVMGNNTGLGNVGPAASGSMSNNSSLTQTGALAQSTKSAATVAQRASWELLSAAALAWLLL
jgi:hypothetical protein